MMRENLRVYKHVMIEFLISFLLERSMYSHVCLYRFFFAILVDELFMIKRKSVCHFLFTAFEPLRGLSLN